MKTVAGIFSSRSEATRAAESLRALGITDRRISLLSPNTTPQQAEEQVPTTETEQPGMGKAMGGAVGAALGAAGGMQIGAAAASLLVPGVGPVLAAGIIGAALLGVGGAAVGAATGDAIEDELADGLPHDELYVYEDALRQGRSVVIAFTESDEQREATRRALEQAGAESIDAARDSWWVGLRDAEEEEYRRSGRDFRRDESVYRRGFEAALNPRARGKSYEEAREPLGKSCADVYGEDAFRCGYERGRSYQESLREKFKG